MKTSIINGSEVSRLSVAIQPARHEELEVSEEQFREFAEAITVFWKSLPEGLSYSGMGKEPKWFGKAYEKVKCDKEKRERKAEE